MKNENHELKIEIIRYVLGFIFIVLALWENNFLIKLIIFAIYFFVQEKLSE
jgi:hypothetical protein